jgi:hypothetical protein
VTGDKYAAGWVAEAYHRHGIKYQSAELSKSDIYLALLGPINAARVDLLDLPALRNQFLSLERRTARGGRDSVDHKHGAHDDLCNAVAGACVLALPAVSKRKVVQFA